jgi:hypothetical protein
MINYLPGTSAAGGIPDTVNGIVAGLCIARPPTTSLNSVNLSLSSTTCCVPLTNLQIRVGGQNNLASTLFSTYENFISQVNLAEQLTSSDFGVSTGLINQPYWEWSRYYFVNVERSNDTDKLVARNINISFLNTSLIPIDCMVFVFFSDEITINVNTGIIDK